jgi:hypothetical protein
LEERVPWLLRNKSVERLHLADAFIDTSIPAKRLGLQVISRRVGAKFILKAAPFNQ